MCIQPDEGIHLNFQTKVPDQERVELRPGGPGVSLPRLPTATLPIPRSLRAAAARRDPRRRRPVHAQRRDRAGLGDHGPAHRRRERPDAPQPRNTPSAPAAPNVRPTCWPATAEAGRIRDGRGRMSVFSAAFPIVRLTWLSLAPCVKAESCWTTGRRLSHGQRVRFASLRKETPPEPVTSQDAHETKGALHHSGDVARPEKISSLARKMVEFVGSVDGPADMASNHGHYAHEQAKEHP